MFISIGQKALRFFLLDRVQCEAAKAVLAEDVDYVVQVYLSTQLPEKLAMKAFAREKIAVIQVDRRKHPFSHAFSRHCKFLTMSHDHTHYPKLIIVQAATLSDVALIS